MRVATIDIGTNAVLLLVADGQGGALQPVLERAAITRLGEGVDSTRRLLDAACHRTLECLRRYAADLREQGAPRLDVVGTSALRDAHGGREFIERATQILGVAPRVIDGQEEARLTFLGALSGLPQTGKLTVFDVGGGSTEVVVGARTGTSSVISRAVSLDIGSVRLFERHLASDPPLPSELQRVEADIARALDQVPTPDGDATLVGVAGTITQLMALALELDPYDAARVHGATLRKDTVVGLAAKLASLSVAERRALPGMEHGRADVLVVGSAIARAVLQWSGAAELIVSDRGVRWGLAEELARKSGAFH